MNNWTKATYGVSVLLGVGACVALEPREMVGVGLLFLSVVAWERAKVLVWLQAEEDRKVAQEARRLEDLAKREADLKSRRPGRGRNGE